MESLASSFSDVSMQDDTHKNGSLTGIPRKIKDNCIDFHGLVQRWKNLTIEGYERLKQIRSCLSAECSKKEAINNRTVAQTLNEILSDDEDDDTYGSTMEKLTQELLDVIQKMKATVLAMSKIVQKLKSISELAESEAKSKGLNRVIYFQTWPVIRFYEVPRKITNAYMKELKLKQGLLEEIPRLNDQFDIIALYWTNEPYITIDIEYSLMSILVECEITKC